MRSSAFTRCLRGFSLLEVLVAVVIVSVLLAGGMHMTSRYVYTSAWDRLFDRIEQQFSDVNVYALAGFSAAYEENIQDLNKVPEYYHLYFRTNDSMVEAWYLETQQIGTQGVDDEYEVVYQQYIDFEVDPIVLEGLSLQNQPDLDKGLIQSYDHVFVTWSNPFADLSFQFSSAAPTFRSENGSFGETFRLTGPNPVCEDGNTVCHLTLSFLRPGSTDFNRLVLSQQKGVYREFY